MSEQFVELRKIESKEMTLHLFAIQCFKTPKLDIFGNLAYRYIVHISSYNIIYSFLFDISQNFVFYSLFLKIRCFSIWNIFFFCKS